jgi:hypothetical protein
MTRWPFFATALVCLLAQYSAAAGTTQATGRYTIAYASFAPVHS